MRRLIKMLTVLLTALLVAGLPARAQRTSNGGVFLSARGGWSLTAFGGALECGQYSTVGYWKAAAEAMDHTCLLVSEKGDPLVREDYMHVDALASYMFKVFATYNRVVNLYVGPGVFLGVEIADPFGFNPNGGNTPLTGSSFLYGARADAELEVFFWRNIAAFLDAGLPVNFSSRVSRVHFETNIGIRYNF